MRDSLNKCSKCFQAVFRGANLICDTTYIFHCMAAAATTTTTIYMYISIPRAHVSCRGLPIVTCYPNAFDYFRQCGDSSLTVADGAKHPEDHALKKLTGCISWPGPLFWSGIWVFALGNICFVDKVALFSKRYGTWTFLQTLQRVWSLCRVRKQAAYARRLCASQDNMRFNI